MRDLIGALTLLHGIPDRPAQWWPIIVRRKSCHDPPIAVPLQPQPTGPASSCTTIARAQSTTTLVSGMPRITEVKAQIAERLREVGRVAKQRILAAKDRLAKGFGHERTRKPRGEIRPRDRKREHDPGTMPQPPLRVRMAERGRSVPLEENERTRIVPRQQQDRGVPKRCD